MEAEHGALWKARIVWLAVVLAAPIYCAVVLLLARQHGGPVIDWPGLMGGAAPAGGFGVLAPYAFMAPLMLLILRSAIVGPPGGMAAPIGAQPDPQDEAAVMRDWLRRQVLFLVLADALPVLVLLRVLVWGSVPLLWLVSAEYVVVMLFYFPRRPAGLSESPR